MQLYRRMKQGNASEVSAIIERIKSSDEIPDMSGHEDRLPRSLDCAQLAANAPGLVDLNAKSHAGSSALLERESFLALDNMPESTSSSLCALRHPDFLGLPSSHYDNGCLSDPPTTIRHTTLPRKFYTNAEHESAVGFSLEYEPLLRRLLSSNVAAVRQGLLVLQTWNVEIRKMHDTEQFFSLSFATKKTCIYHGRDCARCAPLLPRLASM
jgi:hypothetical protein